VVPQTAPGAVVTVEEVPFQPAAPPPPAARSRLDLYLAGGGGLLAAGGTVAWLFAYAEFGAAKDACNSGPGCTDSDRSGRIATIERLQTVAIGAWIAGGALLVASGTRYVLRRNRPPVTVMIDPVNHAFAALATF
jgi:hypothetical protein